MVRYTIYNPKSGRMEKEFWRHFTRRYVALLGDLVPLQELSSLDLESLGPEDAVIAVGGDGTVRAVVDRCGAGRLPAADMPTILLLPAGTSNSVGRSLVIPVAAASWPGYIREHRRCLIDAGRANGKLFLLCVSAGFSGAAVTKAEKIRTKGPSVWAYALACAECLFIRETLEVETEPPIKVPHSKEIVLANMTRFAGVVKIAGADPADGLLALAHSRLASYFLLRGFISASGGSYVPTERVRRAKITGRGLYEIDGEPGGELPVEVEVLPAAVPFGLPR